MNRAVTDPAIKCNPSEIVGLRADAARFGKAAGASALAGRIPQGVTGSMDIEQIIYEACQLQDAESLFPRLSAE